MTSTLTKLPFPICSKTMAKEEQSSKLPSLISSLPHEVIVNILARVSRFEYPTLSLVSKHFRSLVASPEVYVSRSLLECKEHCIYVFLYSKETRRTHCYILHNRRLVQVSSLPSLPLVSSFVVVGSKIYVFGVSREDSMIVSIDCGSYTVQPLPSMPVHLSHTIANIIDGRIYVIGNRRSDWEQTMVVFNTETQKWEPEMTTYGFEAGDMYHSTVVMADNKLYTRRFDTSFVYNPKERKWETDEILDSKKWRDACVIDDVLYYYECESDEKALRAYDRKQKCWRVVKGLEAFLHDDDRLSLWSCCVNNGGKLMVLYPKGGDRKGATCWCAEISLERRQGGEIWGKVEWSNHLLTGKIMFIKSLNVVV